MVSNKGKSLITCEKTFPSGCTHSPMIRTAMGPVWSGGGWVSELKRAGAGIGGQIKSHWCFAGATDAV